MKNLKKIFLIILPLLAFAVITGCKKNKDEAEGSGLKNIKLVISTSGLSATDELVAVISSSNGGTSSTNFKINGVEKTNQSNYTLQFSDFVNGTVTIESVRPLLILGVGIGGDVGAFTYTINATINGTAKAPLSGTAGSAQTYTF